MAKKPRKPNKKRDVGGFTKRARQFGQRTMAATSEKMGDLKKRVSGYAKDRKGRPSEHGSSPMRRTLDSTAKSVKKATGKASDSLRQFGSSRHHRAHRS